MHPQYFLDIYKIAQESFKPINEIEITDKNFDELDEITENEAKKGNEWRFKRKEI